MGNLKNLVQSLLKTVAVRMLLKSNFVVSCLCFLLYLTIVDSQSQLREFTETNKSKKREN